MADKENDKPENKGLGRVTSTLFRKNSDGESLAGEIGKGVKRGLLLNIGTTYRPLYGTAIILPSLLFSVAVTTLPMNGELVTPEDPAMTDATMTYGFSDEAGYQAVRMQERDVVLVKDENSVWRVYLAEKDRQGDIELRFVDNRYEAYGYVRGAVAAMQTQIAAYENYRRIAGNEGELVQFDAVTKRYEHEEGFRRAAAGEHAVDAANMRDAFQQAVASWTQAAADINVGGYGFRDDATPVQTMAERPQIEALELAGDMLKLFGLPLAGLMLGAAAIGGAAGGRRQRRNTKTYG